MASDLLYHETKTWCFYKVKKLSTLSRVHAAKFEPKITCPTPMQSIYVGSEPWSYYTHNTKNIICIILKQRWLIMASTIQIFACLVVMIALLACSVEAQLTANFFSSSCPRLQTIVRNAMTQAVNTNRRTGASILRLFFHDCFVNVSTIFLIYLLSIFLSISYLFCIRSFVS